MKILCLLPLSLLLLVTGLAQQAELKEPPPPQLKLEVLPENSTYTSGDRAKLTFRLTSLSDGTICFPRPAFEQTGTGDGYLSIIARSLTTGSDHDYFLEGFWPTHPTDEKLRADVPVRWIRLGMSEPYDQEQLKALRLSPGDWSIQATYHPPVLTSHEREIIESLGCTALDGPTVSADPVTIHIADSGRRR